MITWQGTYTGPTDDNTLIADTLFDISNVANTLSLYPVYRFYLHYDGYSKYFPLWAMARYRNLKEGNRQPVLTGM